jgi:hypothetical protein
VEAAPPGQLKRRVVWVERLSLAGLARLRVESALTGAEVRFEARDAAPAALAAFSLLERAGLAGGFRRVELTLARRGTDGSAIAYRREKELEVSLSTFAARALPGEGSALRRALVCFLSMSLLDRSVFLAMAEEQARSEPDAEHTFLLRRHHALRLLARARPDRRVREDLGVAAAFKAAGRPLLLWTRALAAALMPAEVEGDAEGRRDAVWVEYYPDDVGGYISRAFWKDSVDPARFERVFYNDERTIPIDAERARRVADFGFRWLDAREPWTLGPASAGTLFGLLGLLVSAPAAPWWLRFFLFEREVHAAIWEAAYRRWRVRAVVQHQDFSWQQDAQALALERSGGALVGVHWAEAPYLVEPEHLTTFGVYFAWGVNQSRRLAGKGHDCRDILPCGAWILPREEEIAAIRPKLAGASFTLALFDTSSSERIFISPAMLSEFMLRALELVAAKPGWKVVLKPKRAGGRGGLPDEAGIDRLLERLTAEGRAILLDRTVSPASAGLACDLSLGIGINTAAILAGAFGGRCIHWDAPGFKEHPLVRDGAGSVVFDTLDSALAAVERAAAGDRSVGDFSRWAGLVNHFGDRLAPERVGGWLTDYLDALSKGGDAEKARVAACDSYRARHGVPDGFPERGEWWVRGA